METVKATLELGMMASCSFVAHQKQGPISIKLNIKLEGLSQQLKNVFCLFLFFSNIGSNIFYNNIGSILFWGGKILLFVGKHA